MIYAPVFLTAAGACTFLIVRHDYYYPEQVRIPTGIKIAVGIGFIAAGIGLAQSRGGFLSCICTDMTPPLKNDVFACTSKVFNQYLSRVRSMEGKEFSNIYHPFMRLSGKAFSNISHCYFETQQNINYCGVRCQTELLDNFLDHNFSFVNQSIGIAHVEMMQIAIDKLTQCFASCFHLP